MWGIVAALVVVGTGLLAVRAVVFNRDDAQQACVAYLRSVASGKIDEAAVTATVPEAFFPTKLHKRFRSTCTYRGRVVVMESDPFGDWEVVSDSGLDLEQ